MEKLIYPVWKNDHLEGDDFRQVLREQLAPRLLEQAGVRGLRLGVVDSDVAPAARRRIENGCPVPDGVVSLWVDNAGARGSWEELLGQHVSRFAGYLVTEAEPLVNTDHISEPGQRGHGMYQVVFMQRPPRLSQEQWLEIWQGSHTRVAIDTQSTFGYRQNVVVRPLTYGAPVYSAMVEEYFPPGAMDSDPVFYAAEDEQTLQANMQAMMESCARFIDFDKLDCIPMSEYLIRPAAP